MRRSAAIAVALAVAWCGLAGWAGVARAGDDDGAPTPPKSLKQQQFSTVNIKEQLGKVIPLDLPFRDQDGKDVKLGDYFQDDKPTILTFNYSNCPMLCSVMLNGLVTAMAKLQFVPGQQFKIVTIDLEPTESPAKAKAFRKRYLDALPDDKADAARKGGWTFLVARTSGDDSSIRKAADAVGMHYHYIQDRAQWAHPAALIFLSSRGKITRYYGGVSYDPDELRTSIIKAGTAEISTGAGFVLTCFCYTPTNHALTAFRVMQIGAIGFVVLFAIGFGAWVLLRRRRAHLGVGRS
jgi:protein SCO1